MRRLFLFLLLGIFFIFAFQAFAKIPKYSDLYKYFVDISGWKAEKPTGINVSNQMEEFVTAKRAYFKGKLSLEVVIFSGPQAIVGWAPFMSGMTIDTPEQFMKFEEFKGHKIGVHFKKKKKEGSIVCPLKIDKKSNIPVLFVMKFKGLSYKEALKILEKFPLKDMEKLFR
ncbi:MAG: hypothetical protein JRI44_06255 [Deltaproteobacteria bacterium]|nr:hypothetical protein [Deltaproteobacteria bacterium]